MLRREVNRLKITHCAETPKLFLSSAFILFILKRVTKLKVCVFSRSLDLTIPALYLYLQKNIHFVTKLFRFPHIHVLEYENMRKQKQKIGRKVKINHKLKNGFYQAPPTWTGCRRSSALYLIRTGENSPLRYSRTIINIPNSITFKSVY
jgi:hypothetical protein